MLQSDWLIIFVSFILASWLFLLILAIGRFCLDFFASFFSKASERIVFAGAFGLAAIWPILFLLGVSHLFFWQLILSLMIATTLLFYKKILLVSIDILTFFKDLPILWRIFLIIFILFILFSAITPPHFSEELSYYLTIPSHYALEGGITNLPELWHSYIHSNIQLLTAIAFVFTGYPLIKILIVLINFLIPLAIYVFTSRFFTKEAGLVSTLFFIFTPLYALYQDLVVPDITNSLFAVTALYLIFLFLYHQAPRKILFYAAFLLGTGIAVKLTFGFFTLSCFIVILIIFLSQKEKFFQKFVLLGGFSLIILMFSLPWLGLNWFYVKNPFFPFFGSGEGWQVIGSIQPQFLTFLEIIKLPWLITVQSFLGISFLIFLPFIFVIRPWPKEVKPILLISIISLSLYLFFVKDWNSLSIFNFNDLIRYNISVWIILIPLVGFIVGQLWQSKPPHLISTEKVNNLNVLIRCGGKIRAAILLVVFIYFIFWLGIQVVFRVPKINWLIKQSQPLHNYNDFIYSVLPRYPALITQYYRFHPGVAYLNSLSGSDIKVLSIDPRIFYLEKKVFLIYGFKELPYWLDFSSAENFINRLKTFGITHLIIPNYYEWYSQPTLDFFKANPQLIEQKILKEVYRWSDGRVYQLENK